MRDWREELVPSCRQANRLLPEDYKTEPLADYPGNDDPERAKRLVDEVLTALRDTRERLRRDRSAQQREVRELMRAIEGGEQTLRHLAIAVNELQRAGIQEIVRVAAAADQKDLADAAREVKAGIDAVNAFFANPATGAARHAGHLDALLTDTQLQNALEPGTTRIGMLGDAAGFAAAGTDAYQYYERWQSDDPRAMVSALKVGAWAGGASVPVAGSIFSDVLNTYAAAAEASINAGISLNRGLINRNLKFLTEPPGQLSRVLHRRRYYEGIAMRQSPDDARIDAITREYQTAFLLHLIRNPEGVQGLRLGGS